MINVFGAKITEVEREEVNKVLGSNWLGIGNTVSEFETAFKKRLKLPNFVMVDNASNGLFMSLKLLALPPGSEIILPTLTFASCAQAVMLAGHRPVFADIELDTQNISAATIEPCITRRTGAIMIVHYAGLPVKMDPILDFGFPVVEDCAHAVDSKVGDRYCGTFGKLGVYSYDGMKNLATCDGGGVTSEDAELMERARCLRYCGIAKSGLENSKHKNRWWEYDIKDVFPRCLPNNVGAALGLGQLKRLDENQATRKRIWDFYGEAFNRLEWIKTPANADAGEQHSYFTYFVRLLGGSRDGLAKYMLEKGVYTTFRYHPLHMNPIYDSDAKLPNSEVLNDTGLNIPLHPNLSDEDVNKVVEVITEYGKQYV